MLSVISDVAGLEQIRDEWRELWRTCPDATPFQSPESIMAWLHHLYQGGEIRAIAIREQKTLVALFPLFLWDDRIQHLTLIGTGVTDYNDVLVAPSAETPVISELSDAWETATFEEIRSCSSLRALGPKGRVEVCSVCPSIDLPTSMEDLIGDLSQSSAPTFAELRTSSLACRRQLNDQATWKSCAAVLYAFHHRNRCYGYLTGFNPQFSKLSPSNALIAHAIEQEIKEGATEFDFLRGAEPYKYAWTARDLPNYRVEITR